jgi:hypothetical protein
VNRLDRLDHSDVLFGAVVAFAVLLGALVAIIVIVRNALR